MGGIYHWAVVCKSLLEGVVWIVARFLYEDSSDFKVVRLGEVEVALVMARDSHYSPSSVSRYNEIASINRNPITTEWIYGVLAEEYALLFLQEVDSLKF